MNYTYNGRPIFFSKDGNAICATLKAPELVDFPVDPVGFGDTERQAVNNLMIELAIEETKDRM